MTPNKFSYRILHDEVGINPREFNNIGQLALYPNRYLDSELDINELPSRDEAIAIFPLRFYLHGNLSFSIDNKYPYNDRWDSGEAGYVVVTREQARLIYGKYESSPAFIKQVEEKVRDEIAKLNSYLNNDCWGYQILEDGLDNNSFEKTVDFCWGYYSYKDAENAALSKIKELIDNSTQPTLFKFEPIINKLRDVYL
jgi:hypothetical protein